MKCFSKAFILAVLSLNLVICSAQTTMPSQNESTELGKNNQIEPKRFHSVTELKPEKKAYYLELHANAWPGVKRMIKGVNIQNYSIALKKIRGKLYLFSYFEYVGTDFDADMKKMADDPETQRWWKETDPCQIPLAGTKVIWSEAQEVFYLK